MSYQETVQAFNPVFFESLGESPEHDVTTVEPRPGVYVADCTCGWTIREPRRWFTLNRLIDGHLRAKESA